MIWSDRFEDPIDLPSGKRIETLRQAAELIQKLPKAKRDSEPWQLAGRLLIAAAEGRNSRFLARIAIMKALDLPKPDKEPRRKAAKKYRVVS